MNDPDNPDIFLITSVINTGKNPWSYTNVRSVYSMEDRFQQTLQTIESIRQKMPKNTKIYFAECSDIPEYMIAKLKSATDVFFQFYGNEKIREACLLSKKKGYGELLKTQKVVEYILGTSVPFSRLFKISGRYYLNDSFNSDHFSTQNYCFRKPFPNSVCNPTVVYSVPFQKIRNFLVGLYKSAEEFEHTNQIMYEISMPSQMNPKDCIDCCGVSGYVAIDGTLYEDKLPTDS